LGFVGGVDLGWQKAPAQGYMPLPLLGILLPAEDLAELNRHIVGLIDCAADGLYRVSAQEAGFDLEAGDEAGAALSDIPVMGDLCRVLLVEDGIENRLLRKPRGKLTPAGLLD
jgi:hypothetical protein